MSLREAGEVSVPVEALPPLEQELADVLVVEEPAEAPRTPSPRIVQTTLRDRACFRGHVNDAGLPHGHGVLYTALGTHEYAGVFHADATTSRQRGVQLLPNGTLFAGDFEGEYPHGPGVKRDPFGSQFLGQWREGELDGVGLSIDVDGNAAWGRFQLNEHVDDADNPWDEETQHHVFQALLAERKALQDQETARELELRVLLQGLSTIADEPFGSANQIEQFTQDEQRALDAFLVETKLQLAEVERDADRWKFQEAQLKERQKNLRREINETRTALSYASKYVGLAETRRVQVEDAERTLQSLQLQIQSMEQQLLEGTEDESRDA